MECVFNKKKAKENGQRMKAVFEEIEKDSSSVGPGQSDIPCREKGIRSDAGYGKQTQGKIYVLINAADV